MPAVCHRVLICSWNRPFETSTICRGTRLCLRVLHCCLLDSNPFFLIFRSQNHTYGLEGMHLLQTNVLAPQKHPQYAEPISTASEGPGRYSIPKPCPGPLKPYLCLSCQSKQAPKNVASRFCPFSMVASSADSTLSSL